MHRPTGRRASEKESISSSADFVELGEVERLVAGVEVRCLLPITVKGRRRKTKEYWNEMG